MQNATKPHTWAVWLGGRNALHYAPLAAM